MSLDQKVPGHRALLLALSPALAAAGCMSTKAPEQTGVMEALVWGVEPGVGF